MDHKEKVWEVEDWIRMVQERERPVANCCKHDDETCGSIKAESLLTS